MIAWLNANSGAIQAIASLATLVVTLSLALLTAKYVKLTGLIAHAAAEQSRHLTESSKREGQLARSALQAHAARLLAAISSIDGQSPPDSRIRQLSELSAGDIDQLEALARVISTEDLAHAALAALALKSILGLVQRVQATNKSTGYHYTDPEIADYLSALKEAKGELSHLTTPPNT